MMHKNECMYSNDWSKTVSWMFSPVKEEDSAVLECLLPFHWCHWVALIKRSIPGAPRNLEKVKCLTCKEAFF